MVRFRTRYSADLVWHQISWAGLNLATGAPVKVKGSPLAIPAVVDGLPGGVEPLAHEAYAKAFGSMVDAWNKQVEAKCKSLRSEIERRYEVEATEIVNSFTAAEAEPLLNRLIKRFTLSAESEAQIALRLWLPAK
jgi:hypothetical protein